MRTSAMTIYMMLTFSCESISLALFHFTIVTHTVRMAETGPEYRAASLRVSLPVYMTMYRHVM